MKEWLTLVTEKALVIIAASCGTGARRGQREHRDQSVSGGLIP
jgi:hypothetical protein